MFKKKCQAQFVLHSQRNVEDKLQNKITQSGAFSYFAVNILITANV